MTETLSQLIHGEPGVGKSWYAQTSPAPRLVLDAEGGSRASRRVVNGVPTKQRSVEWNPMNSAPPEVGDWDVCYVPVQTFGVLAQAYAWLNTGAHPFRSVTLDSITEIQKRCRDSLVGSESLRERDWGDLLIKMENIIRYYRDLTFNPIKRVEAVTFIALTDYRNARIRPAVQGALSISLPGLVDLEGYLYNEKTPEGVTERKLLTQPLTTLKGDYEAKNRLYGLVEHYKTDVITSPDIEEFLNILNQQENDNDK